MVLITMYIIIVTMRKDLGLYMNLGHSIVEVACACSFFVKDYVTFTVRHITTCVVVVVELLTDCSLNHSPLDSCLFPPCPSVQWNIGLVGPNSCRHTY